MRFTIAAASVAALAALLALAVPGEVLARGFGAARGGVAVGPAGGYRAGGAAGGVAVFTRVGVPVLIGTAAAFVVSRRSNDNETSDETVTIDE